MWLFAKVLDKGLCPHIRWHINSTKFGGLFAPELSELMANVLLSEWIEEEEEEEEDKE